MVLLPAIKKLNYKFPSIHRNAEKMALSAVESARMFNLDSIVIPYDMCMESEALGNEISLYEDSEDILYPTIPYKNWAEVDQVEITQDDIDTIMEKYPMNILPEAIKICKKEAPDLAVGAWQLGPFTQCGQTIELDKVLKAVFKDTARVEDILDKFSDMIINIGKALQAAGADFITLREPGVGGGSSQSPHLQRDDPAEVNADHVCMGVPEGPAYLRINRSSGRNDVASCSGFGGPGA